MGKPAATDGTHQVPVLATGGVGISSHDSLYQHSDPESNHKGGTRPVAYEDTK